MMYFDQLAMISKNLHHIKNHTNDNQMIPTSTKIDDSLSHTKKQYLLKMLHAVATQGTLRGAKAILPKNKRSSPKLTCRKLKNYLNGING